MTAAAASRCTGACVVLLEDGLRQAGDEAADHRFAVRHLIGEGPVFEAADFADAVAEAERQHADRARRHRGELLEDRRPIDAIERDRLRGEVDQDDRGDRATIPARSGRAAAALPVTLVSRRESRSRRSTATLR